MYIVVEMAMAVRSGGTNSRGTSRDERDAATFFGELDWIFKTNA